MRDGTADWELVQIQIAPAWQGAGIGSHLVRALLEQARQAGAVVRLSVLKANPARQLYERLGFAVVAELDHAYEMAASPEAPATGAAARDDTGPS